MERLYQPDFSCIFGPEYADAFSYAKIDSLVWPILEGLEYSPILKNLLSLRNSDNFPYFYHRKLDFADLKLEFYSSGIDKAIVQAMNLGRDYGIDNSDVIQLIEKDPEMFSGLISFDLKEKDIVSEIKKIQEVINVLGVVLYPSFIMLDLNDSDNTQLTHLIKYCKTNNLFLKIDIGNNFFPNNDSQFTSVEQIKNFVSNNQELKIILSGLDITGDFKLYYQLLKYYNHLWLEIEPRSFGGLTPKDAFQKIFNVDGFVQNAWHRIICGSATPTLESSQVVRGFLEATERLNFAQKSLLRIWLFRNVSRLNSSIFRPRKDPSEFTTFVGYDSKDIFENDNEVNMIFSLHFHSYSITQLIFLTNIIQELFKDSKSKYPKLENGDLFIRSYHTTTSLIINEHESGNFLDLHYKFVEISKRDSSKYMHTVRALENRADFNHYDHELATTYGSRNLTIPILNGRLEIGGRENFYVLATFGPRSFNLLVKIRFLKDYK